MLAGGQHRLKRFGRGHGAEEQPDENVHSKWRHEKQNTARSSLDKVLH
jgi:hypothetical protein